MSTISTLVKSGSVVGFSKPVYKDGKIQVQDDKKYLYAGDWGTARKHMARNNAPEGCVLALALDYWRFEPLVLDGLFINPTEEILKDIWMCDSFDSIIYIPGTYTENGGDYLTPPTFVTASWVQKTGFGGIDILIK